MVTKQKNNLLNRRELLKILGFGGAVLLSSCVSKSNNKVSNNNFALPTGPSATYNPDVETDVPETVAVEPSQQLNAEPSPTNIPTDVSQTLEEKLVEIQQPLSLTPLNDDAWKNLPIIPTSLSLRMLRLFNLGQKMGRDARQFSVIGDCHSSPVFFLKNFEDAQPNPRYTLGEEYAYLQETIDYYQGSFNTGLIPKNGQNVAGVFSPFWVHEKNIDLCEPSEGPLTCELRLKKSAFALIGLEKNWTLDDIPSYTNYLENVIRYTLSQGVIPILSTKANNVEGDHSINRAIVEVSRRFEVPLWNFWSAVQAIPNGGLDEDLAHLSLNLDTYYDFSDPDNFNNGWAARNLTALMLLNFMHKTLAKEIGLGHQLIFILERWIING